MLHYLQRWMDQLRWQRLRPFEKLADMLLNHLEGIRISGTRTEFVVFQESGLKCGSRRIPRQG
jgi:hypothetical protein